jgi:hypothetical integral membrane protein (TIGR02206 family)
VATAAGACALLCTAARTRPGPWLRWAGRGLALVLVLDAGAFMGIPVAQGHWHIRTSLPLALCDVALVVAAIACWHPGWRLGVELTYFWGLAGTLQAVITPDLPAQFPALEWFEFVVGHLAIVSAALFLVVGLRLEPRPGAVWRVYGITLGYTAVVGVFDWVARSNYMFLKAVPRHTSLLSFLGPWPWYIVSAAVVALVILLVLDAPFRYHRIA